MPSLRKAVRNLCHVPRWTIVRTIQKQSVAEHSYLVAVYAAKIAAILRHDEPFEVLYEAALTHDWDEEFTSDLPNPVKAAIEPKRWAEFTQEQLEKRFSVKYHKYSPKVEAILKVADLLEAHLFLTAEIAMGNKAVAPIRNVISQLLHRRLDGLYLLFDRGSVAQLATEIKLAIEDEDQGIQGFAELPLDHHLKARDLG